MPIFLHAGFLHLMMNVMSQIIIGAMMERVLTLYRTAAIYFISGIGGTLCGSLINDNISVGASGAIFGLCGAFVFFFGKDKKNIGWMDNFELEINEL